MSSADPFLTAKPLMLHVIEDPVPLTWYYGVRCSCGVLLPLDKDQFGGKSATTCMHMPGVITVKCACGAQSTTVTLQKFQTP